MAVSNPTPKMVRNGNNTGAPGSGATVAKPGPDATGTIAAAKGTAEAAADRRSRQAKAFIQSPPGAGVQDGRVISNPGGSVYQWDAGLAINDVEGGGSG